jgi:hypothetical protein
MSKDLPLMAPCRLSDVAKMFESVRARPGQKGRELFMRVGLIAVMTMSATGAFAQDAESGDATMMGGVAISTSYNISAPMKSVGVADQDAEDRGYRVQMYRKSAAECADLLATIATSCTITGITVSTQINRSPGVPDSMYATGSVTMQVELK